jgi:predicted transcriptional regulator
MAPTDRALFLSLKPAYADLLLDGDKSVELRRIRPRAQPGTLVVVYASSPVRAVVGTCVVEDIGTETPDVIWNLHGPKTGVLRREFDAYFQGTSVAVAISVRHPQRLERVIPLEALRQDLARFTPPQSFRYLTPAQAMAVVPHEWASYNSAYSGLAHAAGHQ